MTDMNFNDRPGSTGTTAEKDRPTYGSSGGMKDQAGQAASTAADEGKRVTAVAGEEAQKVASEAKRQTKVLLDDAKGQLDEQSRAQRDRVVQTLSSLGEDLDRMSSQSDSGLAAELVQQAAERVRGISERIDGREPAELLDEVRTFARRKPGTFLLGALAAGVVAGRLTRGAQKAKSTTSSSTSSATGSSYAGSSTESSTTGASWASSPTDTPIASRTLEDTQMMQTPRTTPESASAAPFPPEQPGEIR
jgi:hypothetical protein